MGAGAVTGSAWVLGMLQERPTHLGRALRAAEVDEVDEVMRTVSRRGGRGRGVGDGEADVRLPLRYESVSAL